MDGINENTSTENESPANITSTRVAGTRFGQNLWLEVERWRRHQSDMKNQQEEGGKEDADRGPNSASLQDEECQPSSAKKAR